MNDPSKITIDEIPGGVVVQAAHFRQLVKEAAPGVVLYRFEGRTPLDVFEHARRIMDACLARHGRITLIGDGSEWQSYGPGLREAWTAWLGEHKPSIVAVHLLVRSAILKMGVQIVNMLVSGVITAYSDPALFRSEMARLFPTVDLAPLRARPKTTATSS